MDWTIGDYAIVHCYKTSDGFDLCAKEHRSVDKYEEEFLIIGRYSDPATHVARPFILLDNDTVFAVEISHVRLEKYHIDTKYLSRPGSAKFGFLLDSNTVYNWFRIRKAKLGPDGQVCCNVYCRDFVPYAECNLPDKKFICRSCRTNVVTRDLTLAKLGFSLEDIRKP